MPLHQLYKTCIGIVGSSSIRSSHNKEDEHRQNGNVVMTKSASTKIPVIIVESHHHVLEHIHFILRRQKKLVSSWSLLHWDAHPDLACPRCPAQQCFRPHDATTAHLSLYDALDATPSGIAEWILPLVFAGRLCHIQWIRPLQSSMQQLPDGDFTVQVGAWSPSNHFDTAQVESFLELPLDAVLKVNWSVPYYQDEDDVQADLLLPREMQLTVSPEPCNDRFGLFGLDVCLDYFYCHNPFVEEDERLHRSIPCRNYARPTSDHIPWMQRFQSCWTNLISRSSIDDSADEGKELSNFFQEEQDVVDLQALIKQYRSDGRSLPSDIVNILTMPHDDSNYFMSDRLHHFSRHLPNNCPFFISIARSSIEGFTPTSETDHLQESVLDMVHKRYCGCDTPMDNETQCKLQLLRDYGEWEGSTLST